MIPYRPWYGKYVIAKGKDMSDLSDRELLKLRSACRADKESLECCEIFLDRQRSGWRDEHVPEDGEHTITLDKAYEVLGLSPDADDEAVKRAYRARMRETHSDLNNAGDAESIEVNVAMDVRLSPPFLSVVANWCAARPCSPGSSATSRQML